MIQVNNKPSQQRRFDPLLGVTKYFGAFVLELILSSACKIAIKVHCYVSAAAHPAHVQAF